MGADADVPEASKAALVAVRQRVLGRQRLRRRRLGRLLVARPRRRGEGAALLQGNPRKASCDLAGGGASDGGCGERAAQGLADGEGGLAEHRVEAVGWRAEELHSRHKDLGLHAQRAGERRRASAVLLRLVQLREFGSGLTRNFAAAQQLRALVHRAQKRGILQAAHTSEHRTTAGKPDLGERRLPTCAFCCPPPLRARKRTPSGVSTSSRYERRRGEERKGPRRTVAVGLALLARRRVAVLPLDARRLAPGAEPLTCMQKAKAESVRWPRLEGTRPRGRRAHRPGCP